MSLEIDLKIKSRIISAPAKAVLSNLEFKSGAGYGSKFIGVPRDLVLKLLKTNNNEIIIDFIIEGDMSDPKFSLRESFIKRMTLNLAEKLGLGVVEAGKSVVGLGAEGVKEIGKGVKSLGEGIKKLFGR